MLISEKLDNYMGVSKPISISCISSNRIKHIDNDVAKIDDKNKILKNICIIGSNASGKTSIISSIETVQDFLLFPRRKSSTDNKMLEEFIKQMTPEQLKRFLIDINTIKLGEPNNNRGNDKTTIQLEFFVPKRKNNISGVYTYTLIYKNDYAQNGVLLEKLEYRKTYNSIKNKIISIGNNIIESEIGTVVLYKNNNSKNISDEIMKKISYFESFYNEVVYHIDYLDGSEGANLVDTLKTNKDLFLNLCRIADDKIVNVTLDDNREKPKLLFWNSDNTYLNFSQLSSGTRKIIVLGCIIINAITENNTLIIDEIELSLHHSLVNFLIDMNISKDSSHYSQLVFTTHSPLIAFAMSNDQLFFINNKDDNYFVSNICDAIKTGLITKDKNPEKAWLEDILVKNPDISQIKDFIEDLKKH